jgi:dinuclear metal center YbgI/SA1388 family protein
MAVPLKQLLYWLDERYPRSWAEAWDHVGLQIGDPHRPVQRVGITLEAVSRSVTWARENRLDLLICHHPLFFRPVHSLDERSEPGRTASLLIREEIALVALHTNLDVAPEGVSTALAKRLGLSRPVPLSPRKGDLVKVIVFVPLGYEERILRALDEGQAGRIGNYRYCSFKTRGEGTFMGDPGSNPFIGEVGLLERAAEWRWETICPRHEALDLIERLRKVHPYEEMAYDLYPLENPSADTGLGRWGRFDPPLDGRTLIRLLKERIEAPQIRVAGEVPDVVETAAVCGGSAASLIPQARAAGAQIFIGGEFGYHPLIAREAQPLTLIEIGHYPSEKWVIPVLAEALRNAAQEGRWGIEVLEDLPSGDPHLTYL